MKNVATSSTLERFRLHPTKSGLLCAGVQGHVNRKNDNAFNLILYNYLNAEELDMLDPTYIKHRKYVTLTLFIPSSLLGLAFCCGVKTNLVVAATEIASNPRNMSADIILWELSTHLVEYVTTPHPKGISDVLVCPYLISLHCPLTRAVVVPN